MPTQTQNNLRSLWIILTLTPLSLVGCSTHPAPPAIPATSAANAHSVDLEPNEVPPAAKSALEAAEQYELLLLAPYRRIKPTSANFHGWLILGRTAVIDGDTRKKLTQALCASAHAHGNPTIPGTNFIPEHAAFYPRHGIRVTRAGIVTDFIISFDSQKAFVVYDADTGWEPFMLTGAPRPLFDAVLTKAGVSLTDR